MANLYMPVGIPGCGKSFFAQTFFPTTYQVSTDAIRLELTGDENSQEANDAVFETFHQRIRDTLADGWNVYADATNLKAFARENLRNQMGDLDQIHCILFRNGLQALARNKTRERRVPDDVMMYRMLPAYERMLLEIYQEPYDTLTEIRRF